MRQLNEYLSTKVNKNKKIFEKSKLEDVVDFLKEHSFEEIQAEDFSELIKKYKASTTPVYCINHDNSFIRFGNGNREPMFFWRFKDTLSRSGEAIGTIKWKISFFNNDPDKEFYYFDKFKEYICKYFGWYLV